MAPAIRIHNLSKRYHITSSELVTVQRSLREDLTRLATLPFRRLRDGLRPGGAEEFWALKDVSFDVPHGKVMGLVGRNGAGKSTLMKIVSRITKPTSGHVHFRGRVGSLLEVSTGFHPELTGRENVFLNGALLGMGRREIRSKFDEIVAFSEIERFIDTPVKRYSSGMKVRLGFAVAAHFEPEILLLDEVLSVGDVAFREKSLNKMKAFASSGRTVLIVSHRLGTLEEMCDSLALLHRGTLDMVGPARQVLARFNQLMAPKAAAPVGTPPPPTAAITGVRLLDDHQQPWQDREVCGEFIVEITYTLREHLTDVHVTCSIGTDKSPDILVTCDTQENPQYGINRRPGQYTALVTLPADLFNAGRYTVRAAIETAGGNAPLASRNLEFAIARHDEPPDERPAVRQGILAHAGSWEYADFPPADSRRAENLPVEDRSSPTSTVNKPAA